jgi:RNA methyltransferase, TrmH family
LAAEAVRELFTTADGYERVRDLAGARVPVWTVTERALAGLAETVTPQGVVAVCGQRHRGDLTAVLDERPRLLVLFSAVSDPGNAGTVLRTADAAGADAVLFGRDSVDPYNGKCVRASAGSLFHVDLVRGVDPPGAARALAAAGLRVLAADARAECDLDSYADSGRLDGPTAWVFGSEAHGLPPEVAEVVSDRVRVPLYGRAESLNLAAAAAVCLYASARAQRRTRPTSEGVGHVSRGAPRE